MKYEKIKDLALRHASLLGVSFVFMTKMIKLVYICRVALLKTSGIMFLNNPLAQSIRKINR